MLQYFETVHLWHLDIADDQVIIAGTELSDRLDRTGKALDLIILFLEYRLHHAAEANFIVDQHDALRSH